MEAIAILVVLLVAVGTYVAARLAPSSMWKDAAEEKAELTGYRNSLVERINRGRQEGWDQVMMAQVADRLAELDARMDILSGKESEPLISNYPKKHRHR